MTDDRMMPNDLNNDSDTSLTQESDNALKNHPIDDVSNDIMPADDTTTYGFLGSFAHSFDSKSRIVIPHAYRGKLGNNFVIAPSLDFRCIALYPKHVWREGIDKLYRKSLKNTQVAGAALELFAAYSYENCNWDAQGRALIPTRIKKLYVQDTKDVVIIGKLTYALVKKENQAQEHDLLFLENLDENLDRLDEIDAE